MKQLLTLVKKHHILAALSLFIIVLLVFLLHHQTKPHKKNKTIMVEAAAVQIKAMPMEISAPGIIESQQSVTVTPQITGTIKEIDFNSGANVKAGQLLFRIDPSMYSTSVQQAQAILQRDQALYDSEKADADRYAALVKQEYITQQQYDDAKAAASAQAAVVLADEAALKQAQIQLGYTEVVAPTSGKTGNVTLHIGDLVTANSTTPMVTINQLDTVWVDFNIPQTQLPDLLRYQHLHPIKVEVYAQNNHELLGQGNLIFINNTVNPRTGTVFLKAIFANPLRTLWPGLSVNVKVILATQPDAMVVPIAAVQNDQNGNFVYVLKNKVAIAEPVILQRQVGGYAVIKANLKAGVLVLTAFPPDLKEGSEVTVSHTI